MKKVSVRPIKATTLKPLNGGEDPADDDRTSECHLAHTSYAATLTRLELGVMRIQGAFSSWVIELHKHSNGPQLSFQDIALLHCVRLRSGTPSLGEMLIFQHRHDLSSLQYGFKKLESLGCLRKVRGANRRETAYEMTEFGNQITDRYADLRDRMLVRLCADVVGMDQAMNDAAAVLERMTGLYDQATQSLLNEHILQRDKLYARAGERTKSSG